MKGSNLDFDFNLYNLFKITSEPKGWFFSKKWMYLQKTQGRVVCYIQVRLFDGFILQLYTRGEMGICDLEIRDKSLSTLLSKADEWLETYKDGDIEAIHSNVYSPYNADGFWGRDK